MKNARVNAEMMRSKESLWNLKQISTLSLAGNGLIDETEFLQWIARIQALRESPTTSTAEDDDLTQDLVAAFR